MKSVAAIFPLPFPLPIPPFYLDKVIAIYGFLQFPFLFQVSEFPQM